MSKEKQVVAWRGQISTLDAFTKRLEDRNEITTNEALDDMSIAYFPSKNLDYRSIGSNVGLNGIGKGSITLVFADKFAAKGAKITKDAKPGFPTHALLSKIDVKEAYNIFKSSGVHIDYPG